MRRPWVMVLLGAGLSLALLGGCSGRDDEQSSGTASGGGDAALRDESPTEVAGDAGGEGRAEDGGAGGGGAEPAAQQGEPLEDERRVIYTSDLRLRVDAPASAARRAVEIAEDAGGELDSQSEDATAERVELTVRVPSGDFGDVLDELAGLGRVLDRDVATEDVTEQVVDLDSRLANARASVERLRTLFAEAQDVNAVVAIEGALTQREAEVESLAGQLRLLEDRADRSTITMVFVRQSAPEVDEDIPGFAAGFRDGWVAFRNVAAVAVTAAGFTLPFLALAAPVALLALGLRRRRRPPAAPAPEL